MTCALTLGGVRDTQGTAQELWVVNERVGALEADATGKEFAERDV